MQKHRAFVFNPGTEDRVLPAKITTPIRRGDVFRHDLPGGGFGDPLTRDPARVLRDVKNRLVGPESAHDDYGVVVELATWAVDVAATAGRRAELATARNWAAVPAVSR